MSAAEGMKSMSLSVRLLRQESIVEDALRDDHQLEEKAAKLGRLFIGQAPARPPSWLEFVRQFAKEDLRKLVNQSCAAVLFLDVTLDGKPRVKRMMAVSFGTGHHALNPDAFERGFGLRVVLNAVTRSGLRSLDVATLDATTFLKRIQASRDADLQGFGIDIDRDLLRLCSWLTEGHHIRAVTGGQGCSNPQHENVDHGFSRKVQVGAQSIPCRGLQSGFRLCRLCRPHP